MMGRRRSKGYAVTVCEGADDPYICGALHVERDKSSWDYETDEEAARAAERAGVKLLYGIPYVEDGVYLDTPENRRLLGLYSRAMRERISRKASHMDCAR